MPRTKAALRIGTNSSLCETAPTAGNARCAVTAQTANLIDEAPSLSASLTIQDAGDDFVG